MKSWEMFSYMETDGNVLWSSVVLLTYKIDFLLKKYFRD